ncbi:MAG TPA: helix-turn-helix domain-containing protein, partial [Tichowtungia sp.]|nr:helix-turn-helix domain-containing protein [Tichowtungia sp.]
NKTLARRLEKLEGAVPKPEQDSDRAWITDAGVRSMRKRLKLSQKEFARLAGVSLPTVANWESPKNKGKLNIRRKEVFERLLEIKSMGVRDLPPAVK